jgi:hypothetical protein
MIASLATWELSSSYNRILYVEEKHQWVPENSTSDPAVERQVVLRTSVKCLRGFYNKAIDYRREKLELHHERMPRKVRELYQSQQTFREHLSRNNVDSQLEYKRISIQLQRSKWFREKKALENEIEILSKKRQNIEQVAVRQQKIESKMENTSFSLLEVKKLSLGLHQFNNNEAQNIIKECVKKLELKKVVSERLFRSDAGRWPSDYPVTFWMSIGLIISGLAMGPAHKWLNSD